MKRKLFIISIVIFFFFILICSKSYCTEYSDVNNYFKITVPNDYDMRINAALDPSNEGYGSGMIFVGENNVQIIVTTLKKDLYEGDYAVLNGCTLGDLIDVLQSGKDLLDEGEIVGEYSQRVFHVNYGDTLYGNPWQRQSWIINNNTALFTILDRVTIESDDYITIIHITYQSNPDEIDYDNMTIDDWFWNSEEELAIFNSFQYITNNTNYVCNLDFADVRSKDWFCEPVRYCYKNNIIAGYDDYTFAPRDNLTREQLVALLWRIEGKPDASELPNVFSDVPDGQWYTDAIKWAKANGIVNGYGGTTKFGRGDKIIRQDLAIMLRNYAQFKGQNLPVMPSLNGFKDKDKVSTYAVDAVRWAVGRGIISGNKLSDGTRTIAPHDNATRAEAAVMLYKFCENKNTIVGNWEYEGGEYIFHFNADGTGTYMGTYMGTMNLTYTENNGAVRITFDGADNTIEGTWEGNLLVIKDSYGSDVIYIRK